MTVTDLREIQSDMKAILLACGSPCHLLDTNNCCTIYPTRPNACVGMEAGDEQCQDARAAHGLPPLAPIE